MIASPQPHLTAEEYLKREEHSPVKHEYIDGQIFAMARASDAHVTLALTLVSELRNHLRGSGCHVYIPDMKVQLEELNRFYYPDILVTCDDRDRETPNALKGRSPSLSLELTQNAKT
ncbi:Uma2 family endonuclease [Trichocoleus desertorum AS-A10]|uniref:Uma2 family endonuclease n=1 Tax=Trichocoleus desertorum TaxID=1481672 RepID=UPI00329F64A9